MSNARNLGNRATDIVSVRDYGARGDGVTDDRTAFVNAIASGRSVYVPSPSVSYLIGANIQISKSVEIFGDGTNGTVIERGYSPVNDYDGVFSYIDGSSGCILRGMTIRSKTGQTGGCLVSIVPTASGTVGLYRFDHVDLTTTGTSTHQYTVYMDGTARTSAPIGIRGVDFTACHVFGGGISTMLIKGVLKLSFVGGGVYPAGGAATSNIRFDGTASVPSSSIEFLPSDCSCPLSFDRCVSSIVSVGTAGAITNTGNTQNVIFQGYSSSVQNNWINSVANVTGSYFGVYGASSAPALYADAVNRQLGIGTIPSYGVHALGNITGYSKAGSVTTVGCVGVSQTTGLNNGQTFAFTPASAKLFHISTGGGQAVLAFADYASATITLVSNPSALFQASSTPGAGFVGIYKNSNDHIIYVKNNTGSLTNFNVLVLGAVTSTTDPF